MTPFEAADLLGRLTYKPRYTMLARRVTSNELLLSFTMWVPDATTTEHKMIAVRSMRSLSAAQLGHYDEAMFIEEVRGFWRKTEVHELDEWLKLDGKVCNHAH